VRLSGVRLKDIQNEIRAVEKLCVKSTHENIVSVLQHGNLADSPYYFFDMDLCAFNLETYLLLLWKETKDDIGMEVPQCRDRSSMRSIWNIMSQIANGLAFIHTHHEIHRDLKPRNGATFLV
jgi:serine/threonine protein kinase